MHRSYHFCEYSFMKMWSDYFLSPPFFTWTSILWICCTNNIHIRISFVNQISSLFLHIAAQFWLDCIELFKRIRFHLSILFWEFFIQYVKMDEYINRSLANGRSHILWKRTYIHLKIYDNFMCSWQKYSIRRPQNMGTSGSKSGWRNRRKKKQYNNDSDIHSQCLSLIWMTDTPAQINIICYLCCA